MPAVEAAGEENAAADVVRFGIIGAARIAYKVIRGMHLARGLQPYALGSRSLEKAQAMAKETGMDGPDYKCYGSYQEVLDDPLVDVVYIPLPTALHLEWVTKAAEKGKHVLVEKPPAPSPEELEKILEICRTAGVQFMDGTMWVHNPRAAKMKAILEDEALFGKVRRVNAVWYFMADEDFLRNDIRVKKGLDDLGALGDMGWYCIRMALWTKNYELPVKVAAHPGILRSEEGVVISCGATLVWADGTRANFDCGFDAAVNESFEIVGTKAILKGDDHTIPLREDSCKYTLGTAAGMADNATKITTQWSTEDVALPVPQESFMLEEMARRVRATRKMGAEGLDPKWPSQSLQTLTVVCAVMRSIEAGGKIIDIDQ
eukprot:TRINITY_DN10090_c0_g1_i1.p1 TRINITY_DN10090_c0_g1~~TRINITY_DN10090_c0_g1_i1.p1  ORF type:complete len:412 (+),score=87.95 TRINITY_DN10090_c0_g1_i1:117-1238(+)